MAYFYVMTENQKHTYAEIIDALLTNKESAYFLNYLKTNHFEADELVGLKLFLENNKYNIDLLKQFLTPPPFNAINKKPLLFLPHYKIAASILLVVASGYFIKYLVSDKTSIANYYVEDAGFKVWMDAGNKNIALTNAMSYYKSENYSAAITKFLTLSKNDTAEYYAGICYIKLNQLDSATYYLKALSPVSVYKTKSDFYLALCYLFNNKQNEALKLLSNCTFTQLDLEVKRKLILKDFENHSHQ